MSSLVDRDAARLKRQATILEGIRNYAQWDKSDPFCFARCMTHYNMGLCRPLEKDGSDGHYSATRVPSGDGQISYIDLKRV